MIHETYPIGAHGATLVTYVHDHSRRQTFQIDPRPAIIVLPGGAYAFLSDTEAEPVALTFMEKGFNTFVLTIRGSTTRGRPRLRRTARPSST